jgi:serine/threonine protein kinase
MLAKRESVRPETADMSKQPTGFWRRLLGLAAKQAVPAVGALPGSLGSPSAVPGAVPGSIPGTATGAARYQRQRELGRGSMGAVYLAIDTLTERLVALKMLALQREFSAEDLIDVRQRFMREASAAGHLQHPDILQVLDAGQGGAGDEGGTSTGTGTGADQAWIAMEYVQGRDLSHCTRPGQLLPVTEVLQLAVRLARALDYAHRQGVVHRDIKPANVMFERASGVLKVMDFGIARIADGSRTRTGLVLGTPSFMSPEQLAGLTVDGRSDLYSLGVMLYQLLTGQLPHQSDSMAALMYGIANQAPPDVRHYRPELPEALALVLALALEKRPELRYPNGEQMAQDLAAVLATLPFEAPGALPSPAHASADQAAMLPAPPESGAIGGKDPRFDTPFAQTQRLDASEPGQNSSSPPPRPKS